MTSEEAREILIKFIRQISSEANINFGSLFVVDILMQKSDIAPYIDNFELGKLVKVARQNQTI